MYADVLAYVDAYLPAYLPTCLPICLPACLTVCRSLHIWVGESVGMHGMDAENQTPGVGQSNLHNTCEVGGLIRLHLLGIVAATAGRTHGW